MQAVNVQLQRGIIHVLRHEHIAHVRQGRDLSGDVRRDLVGSEQVFAGNLNVQRTLPTLCMRLATSVSSPEKVMDVS